MPNLQATSLLSLQRENYLQSEAISIDGDIKENGYIDFGTKTIEFEYKNTKNVQIQYTVSSKSGYLFYKESNKKFKSAKKKHYFLRLNSSVILKNGEFVLAKLPMLATLYYKKKPFATVELYFAESFYLKIRDIL